MLAIDTNVLVRVLTTDNAEQTAKAQDIVLNNDVLVCTTVLLEAAWVLGYAFKFGQAQIIEAFRVFGGGPRVTFQEPERVVLALDWAERGLDIADAFHLSATPDVEFATFDKDLAKQAPSNVRLL